MLLGLIQFLLGGKHLGKRGAASGQHGRSGKGPAAEAQAPPWQSGGGLAFVTCWPFSASPGVLQFTPTGSPMRTRLGAARHLGGGFLVADLLEGLVAEERKRSAAILVLFVASALFWASFEQAGSSLSLFARAQYLSQPAFRLRLPRKLVPVGAADFCGGAGAGFRVALAGAGPQAAASLPARRSSRWACFSAGSAFAILVPAANHGSRVACRCPCGG